MLCFAAVDITTENTNLDGFHSQSGSGAATTEEVMDHGEEQKLPAPGTRLTHQDKQEEVEVGVPISTSSPALKESSQVESQLDPVSQVEKGASVVDCAAQNVYELVDQSVEIVGTCKASNESEQSVVVNEVSQDCSEKMEVCPVPHDLTDIMGDNAEAVAFKNREEITVKRDQKVASSEVLGDSLCVCVSNSPESIFCTNIGPSLPTTTTILYTTLHFPPFPLGFHNHLKLPPACRRISQIITYK